MKKLCEAAGGEAQQGLSPQSAQAVRPDVLRH